MSESPSEPDATAEDTESEQPEQPEEFANRAARRAKGKGAAKREVFAKGQAPMGRGSVQSPRQYGNRRSG